MPGRAGQTQDARPVPLESLRTVKPTSSIPRLPSLSRRPGGSHDKSVLPRAKNNGAAARDPAALSTGSGSAGGYTTLASDDGFKKLQAVESTSVVPGGRRSGKQGAMRRAPGLRPQHHSFNARRMTATPATLVARGGAGGSGSDELESKRLPGGPKMPTRPIPAPTLSSLRVTRSWTGDRPTSSAQEEVEAVLDGTRPFSSRAPGSAGSVLSVSRSSELETDPLTGAVSLPGGAVIAAGVPLGRRMRWRVRCGRIIGNGSVSVVTAVHKMAPYRRFRSVETEKPTLASSDSDGEAQEVSTDLELSAELQSLGNSGAAGTSSSSTPGGGLTITVTDDMRLDTKLPSSVTSPPTRVLLATGTDGDETARSSSSEEPSSPSAWRHGSQAGSPVAVIKSFPVLGRDTTAVREFATSVAPMYGVGPPSEADDVDDEHVSCLVRCLGVATAPGGAPALVLGHEKLGDLDTVLSQMQRHTHTSGRRGARASVSEAAAAAILYQVLSGLQQLAARRRRQNLPLFHGQLHSGHVLVGDDGAVRISGFHCGVLESCYLQRAYVGRRMARRARALAPENMTGDHIDDSTRVASDLFAVGRMALQLVGVDLDDFLGAEGDLGLFPRMFALRDFELPAATLTGLSPEYAALVKMLLSRDPALRGTVAEHLDHCALFAKHGISSVARARGLVLRWTDSTGNRRVRLATRRMALKLWAGCGTRGDGRREPRNLPNTTGRSSLGARAAQDDSAQAALDTLRHIPQPVFEDILSML